MSSSSSSSGKTTLSLEKVASSSRDPHELPQKMTVGMIRRGKYYRGKAILTKKNPVEIQGTMILLKNDDLDTNNFDNDHFSESIGRGVTVHLVSNKTKHHAYRFSRGNIGKEEFLKKWGSTAAGKIITYNMVFDWHEYMGSIGVIFMRNHQYTKFYLKSFTLEDVPGQGKVRFICNSWVYPTDRYKKDRVFFTNEPYLPCQTPEPMMEYRIRELVVLRGKGSGTPLEWDREYNYSYYNDLGFVDDDIEYEHPILGGPEYPYPRRCRTGRESVKTDPMRECNFEHVTIDNIYVPRDERFNHIKLKDLLTDVLKYMAPVLVTDTVSLFDRTPNILRTFEDLIQLYEGGIKLPMLDSNDELLATLRSWITWQVFQPLVQFDDENVLRFPWPDLIKDDDSVWMTDKEFAREMLTGVNPVMIRRLEEFPPVSKLDHRIYGYQHSSMTKEHIEKNTHGQSVEEAIENNKLFILDYHDILLPYLRRINGTDSKIYASRTILLLEDDGTLKVLAIELSLPHPKRERHRPTSLVFTPAEEGIEGSLWQFAKAYVVVADCGYHQLITHWLQTHAVIEPFVIAMNRQISVIHPIYKLLQSHFRDTMHINALARRFLINAGGILERTIFPAKFAMEMSVDAYRNWVFTDQALPTDLLKRGVAVIDPSQPHGLRLLLEDYPYAVDGLEIWSAIETWVTEYCSIYYPLDAMVKGDFELQSWWKEVRIVGHGDKSNEPWWPMMNSLADLIETCTIIIWIASAFHAAVNFGQYAYGGYLPNRPSLSRRFMPEPGTLEYEELESNPQKVFIETFTSEVETLIWMSLTEILSSHSSDELYLGQRDDYEWTSDTRALEAFERFRRTLMEIEERIVGRNNDSRLKNRVGTAVNLPYTLLYPNTSDRRKVGGLTGKGIPNSITI